MCVCKASSNCQALEIKDSFTSLTLLWECGTQGKCCVHGKGYLLQLNIIMLYNPLQEVYCHFTSDSSQKL